MFQGPIFLSCKGTSFFQLINNYWLGEKCNSRPLHRLFSLMRKMGVESVIIENFENVTEIQADNEIMQEIIDLASIYTNKINAKVTRFTFLAKAILSNDELIKIDEKDFLATAVLMNIETEKGYLSYILRCYVRRPRMPVPFLKDEKNYIERIPIANNYIHVYRSFPGEIKLNKKDIHKFNISGTFFCQQNGITSVCAQSALKMILNNNPSIKQLYKNSDINLILDLVRKKHNINSNGDRKGLYREEIKLILDHLIVTSIEYDFFNNPNLEFEEYVHRLIESKFPCLLVFYTDSIEESHVVPVLGHTFNSDLWRPEAEWAYGPWKKSSFLHASKWVDNFIIHDDNFGMYLCLPVDSLKRVTLPYKDPFFRAYYALGIVPSEVIMEGATAEYISSFIMINYIKKLAKEKDNLNFWLSEIEKHQHVIRSSIVNLNDYKKHLENGEDFNGIKFTKSEIDWMIDRLPEYFWLCEISTPDLYTANKTKLVDVIINIKGDIKKEEDVFNQLILIRIPGYAYKPHTGEREIEINTHYPLIRTTETLEW